MKEKQNRDILLKNQSTLKSLCDIFTSRLASRLPQSRRITKLHDALPDDPPTLKLYSASDIRDKLLNAGCPVFVAETISTTFTRRVEAWRQHWDDYYCNACKHVSTQIGTDRAARRSMKNLASVIETHYMNCIRQAETDALELGNTYAKRLSSPAPEQNTRGTFNQNFVPILEKYFEANAYPSAGHRIFLAQRSGMTPRQIEVWFQNHRSRTRKEGGELVKNPNIKLSLASSCSTNSTGKYAQDAWADDEASEYSTDNDSVDGTTYSPAHDVPTSFSQAAPSHAFPAPFSAILPDHNPFPTKPTELDLSIPWYRKAAPSVPAKPLQKVKVAEIDDLCIQFMIKVHVRAPDKPLRRRRRRWDAHLCTTPCPAPLPSLIAKPVESVPSRPLKKLPKRRAPASWQKAFDMPNNSLVSLVPPSPVSNELIKGTGRWITRLSRQTRPQSLSRASTVPPTSSTLGSSPSSPAVYSRRRPLESDSSSSSLHSSPSPKRRRTSLSSSDTSSSLSSAIATPQTSSTNLPTAIVTPTTSGQGPDFDFSSLDELFGDFPPAPPLTAAELFQFGFQPPTIPTNKDSFNISAFLSQPQPPVFATTS